MPTLSADVTSQMIKWAEKKVKKGLYKSKSEVVRELFREKMGEKPQYFRMAEKAFAEAWKDEDDEYWESYL